MNPNIYKWEERLVVGKRIRLRRGKEYDCSTSSIIQQARNAAAGKSIRLEIEDQGDVVVIDVKEKEETCAAAD